MTRLSKIFCGITLLTVPTIAYGGYFLLQILAGKAGTELTDFQHNMFRAGHAHAGVLVILSLIAQLLLDHSNLKAAVKMFVRVGFPLAAILISGGFFAAAIGDNVSSPTNLIFILYAGIFLLVVSLVVAGIGLLRKDKV